MHKVSRLDYIRGTIRKARASRKSDEVLKALFSNEDGDAELYIKLNRDKFIYDHAAGRWLIWRGHYWAEDFKNEALRAVDAVINEYDKYLRRKNLQ